jgi:hypothetical protein
MIEHTQPHQIITNRTLNTITAMPIPEVVKVSTAVVDVFVVEVSFDAACVIDAVRMARERLWSFITTISTPQA